MDKKRESKESEKDMKNKSIEWIYGGRRKSDYLAMKVLNKLI